jgi:hypothetical protein
VTNVLVKWSRTGDSNALLSFAPLDPDNQYAILLRVGDRAQTSGDSRTLGYFSATVDAPGAVESQAVYGINVYTGTGSSSQIGVHGIAQSFPGTGNTQATVIGVQGVASHGSTDGGTTQNLFGVSATAEADTGVVGTINNMFGVYARALPNSAGATVSVAAGIQGSVAPSPVLGTVSTATGGLFEQPSGATRNYAALLRGTAAEPIVYLAFTADSSTFRYIRWNSSTNQIEGNCNWYTTGTITAAGGKITAQVAGQALVVGDHTDADVTIGVDTLTTPGQITYKGATTHRFNIDRPVDVTGDLTSTGNIVRSVSAAVSASTTHTQAGGTALTADINNVSVCANADDAVTLPTAAAGMTIVVMNNGAQNLRIWPASGDNLGTGVDTVRGALAAGSNVRFTSFDSTNWEEI